MKTSACIALMIWTVSVAGCVRKHMDDSFDTNDEVTRLDISLDAANLYVDPSGDGSSSVDMEMSYWGSDPTWDVSVEGTTLKIRSRCRHNCDGTVDVRVPAAVISNLNVDSGNVVVRDMDGDADIRADSGNIKVKNLTGNVDLEADSGNISGNLSSEICYADADSGNVKLHFNDTPRTVDVAADSGNITVEVPTGSYDVKTTVDSGNRSINGLNDDASSPNSITADADSGNITVSGY